MPPRNAGRPKGDNAALVIQMALFDAQIALEVVTELETRIVAKVGPLVDRDTFALLRAVRESRTMLRNTNAAIARLQGAA